MNHTCRAAESTSTATSSTVNSGPMGTQSGREPGSLREAGSVCEARSDGYGEAYQSMSLGVCDDGHDAWPGGRTSLWWEMKRQFDGES